ncbi:MAG: pseudouridine synthase [Candidatus Sumerlaeota bacterium]|nr:pseudouridine synthase [Candidatus Sumerlaeota bacterium]
MLNKPLGVTTTASDPHAEKTVMEFVDHYEERLFPVGRLDRDSEGLLLFTNDGELAFRLTHPKHHVEKEYEVVIEGGPDRDDLELLRKGVELDGKKTERAHIKFLESKSGRRTYAMVIHEGRKRQIRRMFEEVGAKVVALRRVRVGPARMGHLPVGSVREVKGDELKALRQAVGLEA